MYRPHGLDLRIYEVTGASSPTSTDECQVWMTSGSRRSAYEDEPWIHQVGDLIARLADERRPQVGICFGHQLTALALGGQVARAEVGWGVGVADLRRGRRRRRGWTRRRRLHPPHEPPATRWCRLPDGAELIAPPTYCPVGAYRVGDHVFCVQGHPEFVPGLSAHAHQQAPGRDR